MAASTAFFGSLRALTSIRDIIISIDEQMISLKKVMDADTNFESMLRSATDAAKEFGRTIDGALKSYQRYAQMGFDQFQVESLARNAMLLSTVGEIQDEKSAEYLTAALLQYNMALEEGERIVSAWNETSNKFPVTVEDLALGFTRAASSANTANVAFDELVGMITSIQASTRRGGQQIGNSLRTIFTNLNSSKAQKALEGIGIAVKDTEGNIRNATEIFGELASKWDEMGNAEQTYVAESVANKFHINNFMALIGNWEMAMDSASASANSHGSALEELATFQEGLTYKINNMKASWQELALVMGSDGGMESLMRGIINSITFMTEGFTELTDATDGWNVKLPVLAAGVYGLVRAFQALRVAATGAKLSLGWIGVGVIGLELLASTFMGTAKAADINTEAVMKNAQQHKDSADRIQELVDQHDKLKEEVEQGANKQKDLKNVLDEIRKIAPHLIDLTGEYGDQLSLNKDKADQYIESLRQMTEEQLKQAKTLAEIELSTANANIDKLKDDLSKVEDEVKKSFDKIKDFQLEFDVTGIIDAREVVESEIDKLQQKKNNLSSTDDIGEIKQLDEQIMDLQMRLIEYTSIMEDSDDTLANYTKKHQELDDEIQKQTGVKERIVTIDQMIDGTYEATEANDALKYSLEETGGEFDSSTESIDEQAEALKLLQEQYNNASSSISDLNGILDQLNEGQGISSDIIDTVVNKYPELLSYLDDETVLREQIKIKIAEQEQAQLIAYTNMLAQNDSYLTNVSSNHETFYDWLKDTYNVDLTNFASLAKEKEKIENQLINGLSKKWGKYYRVLADGSFQANSAMINSLPEELRGQLLKDVYQANQELNSISNLFDNLSVGGSSIGAPSLGGSSSPSSKSGSGGSKSSSSKREIEKHAIDQYANSLDNLNLKLDQSKGRMSAMLEGTAEYNNEIKLQNDLLKEIQSLHHQQNNELRERNKIVKNALNQYESAFAKGKKWSDMTEEHQERYNRLNKELQDNEKQINSNSSAWWNLQGQIESNIDTLDDYARKQREALEKQADEVISEIKKVYEKRKDIIIDAIDEEMKAEDNRHQNEMDNLDEQLKQYEKIVNAKLQSIDRTKEDSDYEDELAKLMKDRQALQQRIDVLSLDNSMETTAKRKELEEEHAQLTLDIEAMQNDRRRELRKRELNDNLEAYRDDIEEKKDIEQDKYDAEKERLDQIKRDTEQHFQDLFNNEQFWLNRREEIINGHVDKLKNKLGEFLTNYKSMNKEITQELARNWSQLNNLIDSSNSARTQADNLSVIEQMKANSDAWHYASTERRKQLSEENQRLGTSIGATYDSVTGTWSKDGLPLYHSGGIVGGRTTRLGEILDNIFNSKKGEMVTKSLKGELQIPPSNFATGIQRMQNLIQSRQSSQPNSISIGSIMDNVKIDKDVDVDSLMDKVMDRFVDKMRPYGFLNR